jgi:cell division protein FtsL
MEFGFLGMIILLIVTASIISTAHYNQRKLLNSKSSEELK